VLQRESLKNQEETLQRIEKIYAISLNNSKRNLEASSNFLQARASLEQAKLDLKNSKLRAGQLERLLGIVLQRFKSFVLPAYDFSKFRPISLEDYRSKVSARQRLATVSLNLDRSLNLSRIEQERPSLDVVGAYSQSGVDSAWGRSFGESWGTSQPKFYLGLQLSFPLDLSLAGRSRARREQLAQAAVAREQYLRSEQDPVLVEDLVSQHNQLVELLAMNIVLEKTQKDKITNERKLLDQGRSSIYQVLQFELDLARAQAGKFSLALELEKIKQQLSLNKYVTYE
jgi:outer membrane protein TolC